MPVFADELEDSPIEANRPEHGRPDVAGPDFPHMDPWLGLMPVAGVPEPVLRVQAEPALRTAAGGAARDTATRQVDGREDAKEEGQVSGQVELGVVAEPWQCEGACAHHHTGQLRSWWRLCSSYRHHDEGALSQKHPSPCCLLALTNHAGRFVCKK